LFLNSKIEIYFELITVEKEAKPFWVEIG